MNYIIGRFQGDMNAYAPNKVGIQAAGIKGVATMMKDYGPGARGIVWATRAKGLPGHAFNVINQRGVIRFLDAQQLKGWEGLPDISGQGYVDFYLIRTK